MTDDALLAAVATLLADVAARPEDGALLRPQLAAKVAEMRRAGLHVRAELLQYEDDPETAAGGDADDPFDNMPV